MKKRKVIFLTGATGFVGSYLLKLFLEDKHKVYVLARSTKKNSARERVIELLKFWNINLTEKQLCQLLVVVEGDITYPNLKINSKELIEELLHEIEILFHSAALPKLRAPLDFIQKINFDGTKNVFDFSLLCKEKGKLNLVNYISTAFVAGEKKSLDFTEDMLSFNQKFDNNYELTKYKAELAVQDYRNKGLNISVFRPSLIMGDSLQGKTNDFRLFYQPLHFFCCEVYKTFPADCNANFNLINVNSAAKAIYLLSERDKNETFHITSPNHIKVGDFLKWSEDFFKYKSPKYLPISKFDFSQWTSIQKFLADPFIPYFNSYLLFKSEQTCKILDEYNFKLPEINVNNLHRVFDYFLRRNIFEK